MGLQPLQGTARKPKVRRLIVSVKEKRIEHDALKDVVKHSFISARKTKNPETGEMEHVETEEASTSFVFEVDPASYMDVDSLLEVLHTQLGNKE